MSEAKVATESGAATTEAPGLLEQVVAATKQTEPDRAQELVKTLVEQALTAPSPLTATCRVLSTGRSPRSIRSFPPSSMQSSMIRVFCSSRAHCAGCIIW